MRILFVDLDLKYANPTRVLTPLLLSEVDAVYFGPGYTSSEHVKTGLDKFIRAHGKFDALITTEHIAFADQGADESAEKAYSRNYCFNFPKEDLQYRRTLLNEIRESSVKKIVLTLESDYYNFTQEQINNLDRDFDFLVGWGDQFLSKVSDLPELRAEVFGAKCNDNWLNYVSTHSQKIIPMVHFVGDNEFNFGALSNRRADFCVPGTPYTARCAAMAALKSDACSISRKRRIPVSGLLTRIGMRPLSWNWFLTYYQESFREEIRQARMSFTCGSALRWPIRKFFEIPALGSVLLCQPCNGFEALGFRNGVNAVICDPMDVPVKGRTLMVDLDLAQAISDAGRRLISECHTVCVRARQLRDSLESCLAGHWLGARWHDGHMVPNTRRDFGRPDRG